MHVLRLHVELVLQHRPLPHGGGHLIFGNADLTPDQILRPADAAVAMDEHVAVPKVARREHGYGNETLVAAGDEVHVGRHRHLADVELGEIRHSYEQVADRHSDVAQGNPLWPHRAVDQRHDAIRVVSARIGQCQLVHGVCSL